LPTLSTTTTAAIDDEMKMMKAWSALLDFIIKNENLREQEI
jgi:hypothetical protein